MSDISELDEHEHVYRCQDCGGIQDITQALEKQKKELLDWCEREVVGTEDGIKKAMSERRLPTHAERETTILRQEQRQIIQNKRKEPNHEP